MLIKLFHCQLCIMKRHNKNQTNILIGFKFLKMWRKVIRHNQIELSYRIHLLFIFLIDNYIRCGQDFAKSWLIVGLLLTTQSCTCHYFYLHKIINYYMIPLMNRNCIKSIIVQNIRYQIINLYSTLSNIE